jgi:cobalt-precorrin 5A hydrolase
VQAVVTRPQLVVGLGAARGVPAEEVVGLVECVLADAGLPPDGVAELATVESKTGEAGLIHAAARLGVPLRGYPAAALATVTVPNPSPAALAATGTPGVCEAAALLAAGPGGELLVAKQKSAPVGRPPRATCAVALRPVAGRGTPVDALAGRQARPGERMVRVDAVETAPGGRTGPERTGGPYGGNGRPRHPDPRRCRAGQCPAVA